MDELFPESFLPKKSLKPPPRISPGLSSLNFVASNSVILLWSFLGDQKSNRSQQKDLGILDRSRFKKQLVIGLFPKKSWLLPEKVASANINTVVFCNQPTGKQRGCFCSLLPVLPNDFFFNPLNLLLFLIFSFCSPFLTGFNNGLVSNSTKGYRARN